MFSEVDPAHLQVLVFSSKRKTVSSGSYVFKKGRAGAAAYLILSGRGVVRSGNSASSPNIARVEKGALLGEMSMVGRVPYTISVQAVSDMELLKLTNDMFMRVCEEFPSVGQSVLSVLADKLNTSLEGFSEVKRHFDSAKTFSDLKI